jgi:phospholipid/cholesterol/gamma-HCH transport system substrate-binding protein
MNPFRNHKVLGIGFLCLLLLGVWLTYAVFTKKFTQYDEVMLKTSSIGLQLPHRADVKVRGVIVGEVIESKASGEGAVLTLGLFRDRVTKIPANVTGNIVPKTLFGEKYVSLEIPDSPDGDLKAGDAIARTQVSIELERVLSDLYPLLRAVAPAEINKTLNAMATALEGRGELIGENLVTLDSYLKRVNPQIPDIVEDLRLTSRVSDLYVDVLPEIATILRNTIKTGQTLEGREKKLQQFLRDVGSFSDTTTEFLDKNDENIIRLGELSVPQLGVLKKYAPEYPCLIGGVRNAIPNQAETFRGFILHINLELLPNQPRGWHTGDLPVSGAKNGPYCGTLPNPPYSQENRFTNVPDVNDGVEEPTGKGTRRVAPGPGLSGDTVTDTLAGSFAEDAFLSALLGPALGVSADDVPDLATLLIAPMARGAEVSLR